MRNGSKLLDSFLKNESIIFPSLHVQFGNSASVV